MSASLAALRPAADVWSRRRERALALCERYPHADEMLRLYASVVDAQERAYARAWADDLTADAVPAYAAARVIPEIVAATVAAGPELLREAAVTRLHEADLEAVVRDWLMGRPQEPTDTYLARAAAEPVLVALPARERTSGPVPDDGRHCPACGGPPQVAYLGSSGEALVSAPRRLVCARCGDEWVFPRMTCAGCGEATSGRLPIFAEQERFPHIRVDACESCRRYILTVDLRKEPQAVPVVDEIAALPLDIAATDRGFAKLTPSLMGV